MRFLTCQGAAVNNHGKQIALSVMGEKSADMLRHKASRRTVSIWYDMIF
jgi:hypothetical protein